MARKGLQGQLGPLPVAIGDFQVRKGRPLMRFYYPCAAQGTSSDSWVRERWLPRPSYAFGFISNALRPSSSLRRAFAWILACFAYMVMWPQSSLPVSVGEKLVPLQDESDTKEKLPVIVFSHGLWACRTTYTALCCDFASHGYIVIAPEHLDGSANIAFYLNDDGEELWIEHKYADEKCNILSLKERANQLKQRVEEINAVLNIVESLNRGEISQTSNLVTGKLALKVDMFRGRIDTDRMVLAGHSFGGATSIVAAGYESRRIICCLGLDVWWEPVEKTDYEKAGGDVPVLLLNTEKFDWEALREGRLVFLNARAEAAKSVTKLATIKGTAHQDQSDLPLLLPKKMALAGKLDAHLAKDINSRACLEFLQENIPCGERRYPTPVTRVQSDSEFLVFSDL